MQSLDILGGIELTASAAVLSFVVASLAGEAPAARSRALAVIGAWFVLVVTAGAFDVLGPDSGLGTPALGIAVVAPVALLAYSGLRSPAAIAAISAASVPLLIGIHAVRVLGVNFVLLIADGRLPVPFASAAGWGDILIGVTALPVAWAYAKQVRGARAITLAWNSLGVLDLVNAIAMGATSAEGSPIRIFFEGPSSAPMTTLPWILIPAFVVPLLMVLHFAVFYRLASPRRVAAPA